MRNVVFPARICYYFHTFYKYMYVFSYCIFVGGLCTVSSESLYSFQSEGSVFPPM